jgi:hypothetical protein
VERFLSRLKQIKLPLWVTPLVFLAVSMGAYGVFFFQQSFHWDDWGFAWLIRTLGSPGFFDYFSTNRPFLAYVYSLTTPLLGTRPWAWQLFSIFWQTLAGIALWWVLRLLWPGKDKLAFWVTTFFLVYPGFNQHAIAITYSHFFMALTAFFVSIGLMLKFSLEPRRLWWAGALGVILAAINLLMTEYFFGLDLLRSLILWFFLGHIFQDWRPRLRRTVLVYLPFLAVIVGFLLWRVFGVGFHLYQPTLVQGEGNSFVSRLLGLPAVVWNQWTVAGPQAWAEIFQLPDFLAYGPRLTFVYFFVIIVIGVGLYLFVKNWFAFEGGQRSHKEIWQGLILGFLAMVLAGVPFLVTELPLRLTFPNSRFTLPFALGSSLILAALLDAFPRWFNKAALAAIIVALAVGVQFNNGFLYRADSNLQSAFFWQMVWRMPELKPGTILLSSDTPFQFSSDSSLTMPLNWTYSPDNHTRQMDYAYFFVSVRLGHELEAMKPGLPIYEDFLAAEFESSSSQMVAVHYAPPGCFRVLDPVYDADLPLAPAMGEDAAAVVQAGIPVLPRTAAQALPLSNLSQIIPDPKEAAVPPPNLGPEPAHTWCYYFEKADLARQQGNWKAVAKLGDEAFAVPYYPDDPSEFLPFIEAYARQGRWQDARDLTRKTANLMPILRPSLCAVWQRVETDTSSGIAPGQVEKMKDELKYCPYP